MASIGPQRRGRFSRIRFPGGQVEAACRGADRPICPHARQRPGSGIGRGRCNRYRDEHFITSGKGYPVSGATPCPAIAWVKRMLSPEVGWAWAWWSSLSTVALASDLGRISSKPDGCKFEETATERRS